MQVDTFINGVTMKASRGWGDCSICGGLIARGDDFDIKDGEFKHKRCNEVSSKTHKGRKKMPIGTDIEGVYYAC